MDDYSQRIHQRFKALLDSASQRSVTPAVTSAVTTATSEDSTIILLCLLVLLAGIGLGIGAGFMLSELCTRKR